MSDSMLSVSDAPEVGSTRPAAGEGPTGPDLPELEAPEGAAAGPEETPSADAEAVDAVTEQTDETPEGDKPAAPEGDEEGLFFGKYKSYDEAEKGFKELQAKLREKAPEAPEEYDFDFSQDTDFVDAVGGEEIVQNINPKEDPRYEAMDEVFKKHNLTQEAVDDIIKTQIRFDASQMPDLEAEANSLGEERDIIMASANHFVQKHLSPDEQEIAVGLGQSAAGVKLLYKMSQMIGEKQVPQQVDNTDAGASSSELYANAFAYKDSVDNFENNEGAKARYDRLMDAAIKKEQKEKGE